MQRLRLLTFTSLAVLSSCKPPDTALRVNVTVRAAGMARVRADCLRLTISDDTQELKSLTVKRPADDSAVFGVLRGDDLPATVKVQASGYIGSNCSDDATLKLNAQGEVVTGVFPESGVTELAVFVDPPNSTLDGDRDGFVGAMRGGSDCKDDDNSIFPGAGQICANTVDTDCDGAGGCDDSECGTAVVCADPPDRVRITTTVTTMLRHECRGPFKVELYNANGVRRAIRDTTVALGASLPGVTVHGTATCSAPVASVLIPYDSSSFDEVYLKTDGQAFGITTLTATANQVPTPGTVMVEVHPQPVDRLEFTSPPRTVSAGGCGAEPITLELRDAQNRRTDVDAPATVTLTSNPGDVNPNIFFSDAACGTPGDTQMLIPGQGSITVYVLASRAGSFQLMANVGVGANPTQPLTVQPAVPSQLAFTNGPLVLSTTQTCSAGLFTVQLQDRFDNPVNAAADVGVRMSVSGLVGVTLYDPPGGCSDAPRTDFTIPAGSNSVSLRAKGMTAAAQPGEIRANALTGGGTIADAVQALRISAGMASKFVLTGMAQSPLASVCSANPFSIDLRDSADNPASLGGPVTFALSTVPASTDTTFEFFSGAGCQVDLNGMLTVPAGQTSATFFYRGNRAVNMFEIRAMSTLTAPSTFLPGNSIRPGPPGKLVFIAPLAQTAQAGSCTPGPYVANVLDLFDNQTSFTTAQTVTVGSNPAGVTVGSSACSGGSSVLLAAGAQTVSFTAQHTVTTPTTPYALTASVNGFSTTTPVTLNVTPGPSTLIVDTPAGGTSSLMAGACQQITLSRRDNFNNNAPTSGVTPVTLTFPGSTTWLVYASNNCTGSPGAMPTMNNTHTVTFSVRPQTAGSHQVTAAINSGGPQSAPINFQVSAGAPTLVFTTPVTAPAPGVGNASASAVAGTCMPITVARKDTFGNDVPLMAAANVAFTVAAGTTIHSGTPCLPGNVINPVSGIPLTATDSSASFYVYATRSLASGGPQLQNVIIGLAAQTANLALTVSPAAATVATRITLPVGGTANLLAHECQRVNVERRDAFGNLVPAAGSNLTVTPGASDMQTFTSVDCTGTPNLAIPVTAGASTRDFSLRLDTAGPAPRALTVTVETVPAPLSLTISPAATTLFQVQGLPATMISGACVGPLTLRRRDSYNNDTTNGTISVPLTSTGTAPLMFSTASDCSGATASSSVGITDLASVSGQFYVTATQAAAASFSAVLGGASGMGSLTVNPAPPSEIIFTTPVRTFTASVCGGAGNVINVQLRDPAGNPSNATGPGQAFTAVSSSGGASWFTNATCATAAAGGNFTIPAGVNNLNIYYRDTAIGAPVVSLTNGSSLTNPTPQTHAVMVGPAARLAYLTPVRTFTAAECGGAASVITVQLQDANGNAVNAGGSGQAFTAVSNSTGTVTWYTDSACSTVATGGIFTIPAGSNTVSLYYLDTRAPATPTVTLTNGSSLSNPMGQIHTVNVGAPARLVFTSTAQTLAALSCSAATVVTMQDAGGNVVNAGSNRQIAFSATPGAANTTFYSNSGCSTALTNDEIQMNSGNSSVTIYFRAENAGAITLAADTTSIMQGTQGATITLAPPTQLNITTVPPATMEAGFCLPVAVERLDSLNRPSTINSATVITPTFAPTTGASLFSDVNCTSAIVSTFSIASGASTTTVYVKGINGSVSGIVPGNQAYTFTMTSGAMNDNVVVTVQPMVRRRNAACTLGGATINCPITPTLADISRTILFFQATPAAGDNNPSDDNVSCHLDPNGGVAQVVCDRDGSTDNISIEWQTVSFAYSYMNGGVTVQQVTASCAAAATNAMPINVTTSAPRANSFVLFSSRGPGAGGDNDADNFFTAQLTTDTNLQFRQSAGGTTCTRSVDFDAQVVSWANATVTRAITAGGTTTTPFTVGSLSLTPASTFLLYSSRMAATGDLGGNNNICRRRLRGEITSGTTLNFHRGCSGADVQDISWEAVQVPAGRGTVQQVRGTTASGQAATPALSFTCADLSRCVLFMGGQGPGGSATGSTTYAGEDRVGAALARPVITSTTAATYLRGVNNDVGDFTGYLLQLNP